MSVLDELRESLRRRTLPMNSKRLQREIADAIDAFEAEHPLCEDCRHWRIGQDGAVLGKCCVSGSFRAPGGLFTERDFGCIHGRKS